LCLGFPCGNCFFKHILVVIYWFKEMKSLSFSGSMGEGPESTASIPPINYDFEC
jgi:hypothetical protein